MSQSLDSDLSPAFLRDLAAAWEAARAEVARLTAAFTDIANEMEGDGFWPVAVANIRAALRQPAPATAKE